MSNYGNWGIPTGSCTVTKGLFCLPSAFVDPFDFSLEHYSTLLLKHPFSWICSTHPPCNVSQVLSHQIRKRSLPDSNSLRMTLLFGFDNVLHFKFRHKIVCFNHSYLSLSVKENVLNRVTGIYVTQPVIFTVQD